MPSAPSAPEVSANPTEPPKTRAQLLFQGQLNPTKKPWRTAGTFSPWPYIVVYEIIEDAVNVLRIRHASQNWP